MRLITNCLLAAIGLMGTGAAANAQDSLRVVDARGRGVPYALVQIGRDAPAVTDSIGLVRLRTTYGGARVSARRIGYTPFDGAALRSAEGSLFVQLASARNVLIRS